MTPQVNSPLRFCTLHERYYLSPEEDAAHAECSARNEEFRLRRGFGATYSLRWDEVVYYLDKLRTIRSLFGKLRTELQV